MNPNYVKLALPAAALLLAAAACSASQPQPVTPQTTTSAASSSLPPQPSLIVGKYANAEAMLAKIKTAGVPIALDSEVMASNGGTWLYAKIGSERIGLSTFDLAKDGQDAEAAARARGSQTASGTGWYITTHTPTLLNQLATILNS